MEFEFDKEMDSLLRQTAKGENLFAIENTPTEHIDADEISMFAENALPEKAKPRVMKHLADCDKCRTILSNVILLNAEDERESSTVVAKATESKAETVVSSNEIPWYQKLFATRNLAFGMGALALIFAVGIGFVVIQNLSSNGELAKSSSSDNTAIADKSENNDVAESTNPTQLGEDKEATSDSNLQDSSNTKPSNSDSQPSSELSVSESKEQAEKPSEDVLKTEKIDEDEPASLSPSDKADRKNRSRDDAKPPVSAGSSIKEEDDEARLKDKTVEEKSKPRTENEVVADSSVPPPKPVTTRRGNKAKKKITNAQRAPKKSGNSVALSSNKRVNGKTFIRKNGVWTDSAYRNQKTTNVKRNSSQYKKLDKGLRSITDKISGTVIVVWKSKAYKIQ